MTTFYVGIPKNSAHPNAGKLLISLVLSKEWDTSRDGSHHVKGTKYYSWFQKKYADTKFTEFNAETMIKLENQLGEIGNKYRDWLKGK
ncbi:MAG: hypothetical protein ACREQ2_10680 [Candidatus Binatia bacterium]